MERVAPCTAIRPSPAAVGWRPIWWVAPVIAAASLMPQPIAWPLVTGIVILLGVPHGALDGEICRTLLRPRLGPAWFAAFAVPYMLLFAAVLLAWRLAPVSTLLAFLAASVWHFGAEDAAPAADGGSAGGLEVLVRGGLPVALPLLVHPAATLHLLGIIAAVPLATAGWERAAGQGWLVLAAAWAGLVLAAGQGGRLTGPALLAAMFAILPPLPAFATYFVCVHAPAHTARLIGDPVRAPRIRDDRGAALLALPITGLTLAIGAMLWPLHAGPPPQRLVSLTFQMLAALTLPHMLLEAALDRRDRLAAAISGRPAGTAR